MRETRVGRAAVSIFGFIWPSSPQASDDDTVDMVERAQRDRERRKELLGNLPVIVPLASALVVIVNMYVSFGGDANQVRAVLTALPLSQLTLMWLTTLIYGAGAGFLFAAPEIYANPKIDARIRLRVWRSSLWVLGLTFFALPILYGLIAALAMVAMRGLAVRRAKTPASQVTLQTWVAGALHGDTEMRRLQKDARKVLRRQLGGDGVSVIIGPLDEAATKEWDRLHELITKRQAAITALESATTTTDVAFRIATSVANAYLLTWLISPIPLGPTYELKLDSGATIVGYFLEGQGDDRFVIPRGEMKVAVIQVDEVIDRRVCTNASSLWSATALSLFASNESDDVVPEVDCPNKSMKPRDEAPSQD